MTISEVSKKYGLTADTIRYYEKVGLIPKVPKNKSGIREFDEKSCNWVEFTKCMRAARVINRSITKIRKTYERRA